MTIIFLAIFVILLLAVVLEAIRRRWQAERLKAEKWMQEEGYIPQTPEQARKQRTEETYRRLVRD